jgi:uncharacterized membrane protein
MTERPEHTHPKSLDRWLVRGAIAVVVTLQFSLINDFSYGARWLAPVLEIILLIPLVLRSIRAERIGRNAQTDAQRKSAASYHRLNHVLSVALVGVISLFNVRSLLLLVRALLAGATENGRTLLLDAVNIWATNVIVFSLWYWLLDRGGPSVDGDARQGSSELLFTQMTLPPGTRGADVPPGYIDYLFLSFNTSTAFSPTDTMPLTIRMKLLMMLEATVSLLTLALVAARAVNILA